MINILDKGTKHLKFRKKNKVEEIYYILCLEPEDYDEFIDDCLIIHCPDAGENNILKFFNDLGFNIRRKKEDKKAVFDESFSQKDSVKKDLREIQSVIS